MPNSAKPALLYGALRRAQVEVPYFGTYECKEKQEERGKQRQGSTFLIPEGAIY